MLPAIPLTLKGVTLLLEIPGENWLVTVSYSRCIRAVVQVEIFQRAFEEPTPTVNSETQEIIISALKSMFALNSTGHIRTDVDSR